MLDIYIGYDKDEAVAAQVLCSSILKRATAPVSFTFLVREHFRPFFTRERGPYDSTDFSITRFLVPYLSSYQGYSIFMDCDMLCQTDVTRIWDHITDDQAALWVCPHDYIPKEGKKMQGQVQTKYPRKNWSSFMVFNNSRCRALTPDYVNTATGLDLHRFTWLKDVQIGELPLTWNWLVGEYTQEDLAKYADGAQFLHYTLGGPWFPQYRNSDHAREWLEEYQRITGRMFWPTSLGSPEWQPRKLSDTKAFTEPV